MFGCVRFILSIEYQSPLNVFAACTFPDIVAEARNRDGFVGLYGEQMHFFVTRQTAHDTDKRLTVNAPRRS